MSYHFLEPDDCNEGDIRLVNGTVEREGRLEICANGVWGQVCSSGFRKSAAYVACKQLGYTDANGMVKLNVLYMATIGLIIQGLLLIQEENMDMENVQLYIATWIALDMRQNCLSAQNMFILILLVI